MSRQDVLRYVGAIGMGMAMAVTVSAYASAKTNPVKAHRFSTSLSSLASYGNTSVAKVKVPDGVRLDKGAQVAMFAGRGTENLQTVMNNTGITGADLYRVMIKDGNEMRYALLADMYIGDRAASRLTTSANEGISSSYSTHSSQKTFTKDQQLAQLAQVINTSTGNSIMPYRVLSPMSIKGKTYVGTLQTVHQDAQGISYEERFRVILYNDKYAGPSARVLAYADYDESQVLDRLAPYLSIK